MKTPQRGMEDGKNGILSKFANIQLSGHKNDDSAPITRLPNEVLAEIFHQGHISYSEFDMTFRSLVCLVTRHWREVAVDTSSLWTHLAVLPHQTPEYVEMYLRRTKDRPLAICFSSSPEITPETLYPILPPLTSSAHRWRKLEINVRKHDCLQLILGSLRDLKVPRLEVMFVTAWFYAPRAISNHIFTGGAPRLRNVHLGGLSLRRCWPPLENVTTFHMTDPDTVLEVTQFYEMLEALPCVTTLILDDVVPNFDPTHIKKLTISSLRRLIINAGDAYTDPNKTYLRHILENAIAAPNVEILVISGGVYESIRSAFASVAAPPSKFPAVTSLKLCDSFACSMTCELLSSLPGIKELTFIRSGHHGLDLLLHENAGPVLLPHLQTVAYQPTLTFEVEEQLAAHRATADLLCDLVAVRERLGTPIKTLRLHPDLHAAEPERISWLRERVQVEKDDFAEPFWLV